MKARQTIDPHLSLPLDSFHPTLAERTGQFRRGEVDTPTAKSKTIGESALKP